MNNAELVTLCHAIHAENAARGWWTDLTTGQSILATRNRPEMMMLAVSEIGEAWQANGPDDKLPQYHGFDVEIADCFIRLADQLGAESVSEQDMREPAPVDVGLLGAGIIVVHISNALEAYRKGRQAEYRMWLCSALRRCLDRTSMEIINAKRHYNATRADHSLAARLADEGKKI